MPSDESSALGALAHNLVDVLAEVKINVAEINDLADDYARRWNQLADALRDALDNPLADVPTLWTWYGRCMNDLAAPFARSHYLDELHTSIDTVFGAMPFPEPAYTIELLERDGSAPYLAWFLHELTKPKQLAAKTAVERILMYLGDGVVDTEWGDNIGDGVRELRVRRTAAEVEAWWRNHYGLPEPEPEPHEEILLRIYFHPYGGKVILLVGGFDKGAHPNHEQDEVNRAKRNLRHWETHGPG